jgi:hypothetical protein
MACEASVSILRMAGPEYLCTPSKPHASIADTIGFWLTHAGPEVAIQVAIGGLWAPDFVGVQLTLSVLASTVQGAEARLRERAEELSLWLEIHDDKDAWMVCDVEPDAPLVAAPIRLAAPRPRRHCPICHLEDAATERFIEVARRTRTGLLWCLRSEPSGQRLEEEALKIREQLIRRRRRTRILPEVERCEVLMSQLDDVEFDSAAMPFEVGLAIVGLDVLKPVVRFAGLEAFEELTTRDVQGGRDRFIPLEMGVHASIDYLNQGASQGVDMPAARDLLRWVPGVDQRNEETLSKQRGGGRRLIDPRVLFEAS